MCVWKESNLRPLSYQDSVLPLNYTRVFGKNVTYYSKNLKIWQFFDTLQVALGHFLFMQEDKKNNNWWQPAIIMFAGVSVWVAIPIVFALFMGKYLDKRFGTDPWIFITLTGIAFIISMIAIARISMKYIKKIGEEDKIKKQSENIKSDATSN